MIGFQSITLWSLMITAAFQWATYGWDQYSFAFSIAALFFLWLSLVLEARK